MMATGTTHEVDRVGIANPKQVLVDSLGPGEIGFLTASIKSVADCRVGDTLTEAKGGAVEPLPGFKPTVPGVFCGLFPVAAADYADLPSFPTTSGPQQSAVPATPGPDPRTR